jgi:peptide/nickel transport system substrate-binding protein
MNSLSPPQTARGHQLTRSAARPALAALAAVVLGATACTSSTSSPKANGTQKVVAGSGGQVTVRSVDDIDTFDPATTAAPNMSVQAIELTYDRLIYMTPTGKLEPYLASSWTSTPDSATLKIRKGATCADGTPVTPTVVANSLNYSLNPKTNGPYATYVTGSAGMKSVTADEAAGSVTITLKAPYNALVPALAIPYAAPIICPKGIASPKSLNAAPDGSGPYVLDKSRTTRGGQYVFTLRKDYTWGPESWTAKKPGIPSTIVDRVITDESTASNLMTTGQVDIAPIFGVNEQRVEANKALYTYTTSVLQVGSWGLVLNQAKGRAGSDIAVRHAVFLAVDSKQLTEAAFSKQGVTFDTLVTPNMQCYDKSIGSANPPYSIDQAKQLLKQAGYVAGGNGMLSKNGKPLTLKISMWNTTNQAGEYIQAQLQKIGIAATVQNTDINTWITALFTTKNYDVTLYSYYSSLPNPVIFPSQPLDVIDPTFDSLSATAEAAAPADACAAWNKALTRAATNFDIKSVGVSKNTWFAKKWQFKAPYNVAFDPFTIQKTR